MAKALRKVYLLPARKTVLSNLLLSVCVIEGTLSTTVLKGDQTQPTNVLFPYVGTYKYVQVLFDGTHSTWLLGFMNMSELHSFIG